MGAIAVPTMLDTNQSATQLLNRFKCFFGHGHRYAAPTVLVAALLHAFEAYIREDMEAFGLCSSDHSFAMAIYWTVLGPDQSDDVQVESRYNCSAAIERSGETAPVESASCFAIDVSSCGSTGRTGCVGKVIRASPRGFLKCVVKWTLW